MPAILKRSGRLLSDGDGYRMLIIAVVRQAIIDTRGTGKNTSAASRAQARYWLITQGSYWLEAVGVEIDQEWWESWISNRFQRSCKFTRSITK